MKIYKSRAALFEATADKQRLIDHVGQELADLFFSKRKLLRPPENGIYYWLKREPSEMADFLSKPMTKKDQRKNELDEILAMPEANDVDLVARQDGYTIYKINSPEASVKYGLVVGGKADWSISGGYDNKEGSLLAEAKYYFNEYLEDYKDYYFIFGHGIKYALCIKGYKPLRYDIFDQNGTRLSARNSPPTIPNLTDVYFGGKMIYKAPREFEIEGGVLIKYNGVGGDVVIPNEVVKIGDSAFSDCTSLTSVSMPNVQTIGMLAFRRYTSLTSVSMPNVLSIGKYAFGNCTSLTSVEMPNVQTIGDYAFFNCELLTDIDINPNAIIGERTFARTPIEAEIKRARKVTV